MKSLHRFSILLLCMGMLCFLPSSAQEFTEVTGISILPAFNGSIAWGDYDNDGDLDLIRTGATGPATGDSSMVYRNNGNDTFTHQPGITLTGAAYSSKGKWCDFDNDGDLDLFLFGVQNDVWVINELHVNNGDGTFTQLDAEFPNAYLGDMEWGDMDNDGNPDIVLCGLTNDGAITTVLRNNGDLTFTERTELSMAGVYYSSLDLGDYDKDGYLDILLTGRRDSATLTSKVYRNEAGASFTEETDILLQAVERSDAEWGDYDNDGYLDILLSGTDADNINHSLVYRNNGDGTFSEQTGIILPGAWSSITRWGDYDNDGDLDFLLAGWTAAEDFTRIYRNNGDNTFTEQTDIALTGVHRGSAAWGDYDNDGDLDIVLVGVIPIGEDTYDYIAKVYRNNIATPNTPPLPPGTRPVVLDEEGVTLRWYSGSDDETPGAGLTYNVYVYSENGDTVLNAMSDHANGYRRIPARGNAGHNREITLKGLPPGTYDWNVQSVDNNFSGSEFAGEQAFNNEFVESAAELQNVEGPSSWADFDRDGDLDVLVSGYYRQGSSIDTLAILYENKGDDLFDPVFELPGLFNGSTAWGDFDNDGYPDLLLTGATKEGPVSKIFRNNRNKTFSALSGTDFPPVINGYGAWGDYDNDGDADFLLLGDGGTDNLTRLYRNDGDGIFSEETASVFPGLDHGWADWGDYDGDGDLDLLICGTDTVISDTYTNITKIYLNEGAGTFTELAGIGLPGIKDGIVEWGDFDNDGDPDILLSGDSTLTTSYEPPIAAVYRNNGNGTFTEMTGAGLGGLAGGQATWGDYDSDGNLDILVNGYGWAVSYPLPIYYKYFNSVVYAGDGDGNFTYQGFSLTNLEGSADWGDYDGDGDLDILISGYYMPAPPAGGYASYTNIYKNMIDVRNDPPEVVTGLKETVSGYSATLRWNRSTDDHTPQAGLSYNAYLYQQDGDTLWSSLSQVPSGQRLLPSPGNARQDTAWTIHNLELGTYSWSVQAIDQSYKGSAFQAEASFEINPSPAPETHDTSVCVGGTVPVLTATGQNIKWYSDELLGTIVYSGSTFATGKILAGSYTYYVTQTVDDFESQPVAVTLDIHELPEMSVTESSNISCDGMADGSVTVASSSGDAPFTYQWDDDENTAVATVTGLRSGRYYRVTITDANGCTSLDSIDLTEPDPLTAVLTDSSHISTPGVSDGSATVEASGGTTPYSYLWDDDASTGTATANNLSAFTWYRYTVTDDHLCSFTDSIILPVAGEFAAIITDYSPVSCYGYKDGSATVTAFGLNEPFTYLWDDDEGTTGATVNGLAPNRWYRVTVTDASDNTATDSILLAQPDPLTVDIGDDRDICEGESAVLDARDGYQSYGWSPSGAITRQISVSESGTHSVLVTDDNGCHARDTTTITVHPVPDAAVAAGQEICEGESVHIGSEDTGNEYEWTSDPAGFTSSEPNPEVSPVTTTTYTLTESASVCQGTNTVTVTVNPAPQLVMSILANPIYLGDSTLMVATGADSYAWDPGTGLDTIAGDTVIAKPLITTEYRLTGTNGNGCMALVTKILTVNCPECGDTMMLESNGLITHGCIQNNYNNNALCTWTLFPSGLTNIYLCFNADSFDIMSGDRLDIYKGQDATGDHIGTYNNDNPPPAQIILGNLAYIVFTSNGNTTGRGFRIWYSSAPCPTGVGALDADKLLVYPNPTSGLLTVEWTGKKENQVRLRLYNSLGSLLMDRKFDHAGSDFKTAIDMQDRPAGLYTLQLVTDEGIVTRMFVKE